MKRQHRLVIVASVVVTGFVLGLMSTADDAFAQSAAKKKKHAAKKGETVNQMLQQITSRGRNRGANVSIKKQILALPETQKQQAKSSVPLGQVKPPRSGDLFREAGTDEEKLEQVTEQGIQQLYSLTQQYSKSPNRGELWLRLAELYVEKAKYIEYRIQTDYDKKLALYLQKKGPKPSLNLTQSKEYNLKAIRLYEFYLHDFPKSPKVDQALFFLGYNYVELDQVQKGISYYKRLTQEYPNSPYVGEAHFALGEYYFDNDKWGEALKAYSDVLKNRRARLYTFALYKIAWCQYRMGRIGQGLKTLESVVALSRQPGGEGQVGPGGRKAVSKIRLGSEALKDIVLFYADAGNYKNAGSYFYQIGGEKAQPIMLEKLAYLYSDRGMKDEAMYIFKQLLEANPTAPKAFDYQYQIVQNFSTSKQQAIYKTELYTWIENYGPDSAWAQANAQNKKLIEDSFTLRESALRNYVLLLHKNAQNSNKKPELANTKSAYEFYLQKFPSSPKTSEMHFFYGELLYSLNDYPNAAREYQWVADHDPKSKYYEQAVLNTLLALEKGLKSDDEIKELVGDALEPVPFTETEVAFVAAGDRYVKAFPKGEKGVDVRFKIARLHYAYNHFDDAIKYFHAIINEHPKTQYAVYSANLILDVYNLRKDYGSLAKEGLAMMNNRQLVEAGFQTDVRDMVEKATFKKAQDLEVQKNYETSAKAFGDFSRNYPGSSLAASAAFNAGVNYERSHKIPEAIVYYQKVVNHPGKGNENLRNKSSLLLAHLYEQTAQFDKAANAFERYAKDNPKDKVTPDLYYNSAIIWKGEKRYSRAMDDYEKYYETSRKRDRNNALFEIADIHDREGHNKTAQDWYEKYLNSGGGDPEKVVEANFKIAELNEKRGHRDEAEKSFRRTVGVSKALSEKTGKPVGLVYAAEARFRLTDKIYQDFVSIRIPQNPKRQMAAIQDKLTLLTRLSHQLAEVIKYDEGNMVIASLTKLGQAYDHLARAISQVPAPKDLSGKDLEAYKAGVFEKLIKPQQDQAVQNFTAAINKSYEINYYNKWTKIALDAMAKYDTEKFAEPKEIVLPIARTDDMGM